MLISLLVLYRYLCGPTIVLDLTLAIDSPFQTFAVGLLVCEGESIAKVRPKTIVGPQDTYIIQVKK